MLNQNRTRLLHAAFFVCGASCSLLVGDLLGHVPHAHVGRHEISNPSPRNMAAGIPPYGRIEAVQVPLANADGAFPDRERRLASPRWFFEDFTEARLTRFILSCALRPWEQRALLDKGTWTILTNGVVISPSEQLIWSLQPQSREQIYSRLAQSSQNFPQCFPFRFPATSFEERLKHSDVPEAQMEKLKRLMYPESGSWCFTDLQAAKEVLTPEQFNGLVETLYQVPTYILRLHIEADSDIEAMTKYWGKGGREKLISPLLTSIARVPGGGTFNLVYFLPPFARLRLYTYPYTWKDSSVRKQDCFFTSMNFFNSSANTNFYDRDYTAKVLRSDYVAIQENPSFGDVVALANGRGEIVHTCVYIADDFVFTKNGVDPEQPWVLMKLSDMLVLYYPTDHSGHITFLRRRDMT